MRYKEIAEPRNPVEWMIPRSRRRAVEAGEDVPVEIDVAKLDASWRKDDAYIGPNGAGGIRTRYPDFGTWFQARSEAVEMPEVSIGGFGEAVFVNGRHRFSWLRDHGVRRMPVIVPVDQVAAFRKRFG